MRAATCLAGAKAADAGFAIIGGAGRVRLRIAGVLVIIAGVAGAKAGEVLDALLLQGRQMGSGVGGQSGMGVLRGAHAQLLMHCETQNSRSNTALDVPLVAGNRPTHQAHARAAVADAAILVDALGGLRGGVAGVGESVAGRAGAGTAVNGARGLQ